MDERPRKYYGGSQYVKQQAKPKMLSYSAPVLSLFCTGGDIYVGIHGTAQAATLQASWPNRCSPSENRLTQERNKYV
jgi:hypothetical protein